MSSLGFLISSLGFLISSLGFLMSSLRFLISWLRFLMRSLRFLISSHRFLISWLEFLMRSLEFLISSLGFLISSLEFLMRRAEILMRCEKLQACTAKSAKGIGRRLSKNGLRQQRCMADTSGNRKKYEAAERQYEAVFWEYEGFCQGNICPHFANASITSVR
jgi:hypothetical protein